MTASPLIAYLHIELSHMPAPMRETAPDIKSIQKQVNSIFLNGSRVPRATSNSHTIGLGRRKSISCQSPWRVESIVVGFNGASVLLQSRNLKLQVINLRDVSVPSKKHCSNSIPHCFSCRKLNKSTVQCRIGRVDQPSLNSRILSLLLLKIRICWRRSRKITIEITQFVFNGDIYLNNCDQRP